MLVASDDEDVTDTVAGVDPDSCGVTRLLVVWLWPVAGGIDELDDILDDAMLVKDGMVGVGTEPERA